MSCAYCCMEFDLEDQKPIKLSCNHIFCMKCVNMLSEILRYCPIDNILVNFEDLIEDQFLTDQISFKCKLHNDQIIGMCESCTEIFCSNCISHQKCKLFYGSYEKILNHLNEALNSAYLNSISIQESLKDNTIIDFDEGIIWVKEHLNYLEEAQKELETAKNFKFSDESINKCLKKYKNINQCTKTAKKLKPSGLNLQSLLQLPPNVSSNLPQPQPLSGLPPLPPPPPPPANPCFGLDSLSVPVNQTDLNESDNSLEGFMKMMQMFNKPDQLVTNKFNYLRNNFQSYLAFFIKEEVNDKEFEAYFCHFLHHLEFPILIEGFGIGRPSKCNESIFISAIEINIDSRSYSFDGLLVEYLENELTFDYMLESPFLFSPNTQMFIRIEIYGKDNYLFYKTLIEDVSTIGVDGKPFSESFPILYFFTSRLS